MSERASERERERESSRCTSLRATVLCGYRHHHLSPPTPSAGVILAQSLLNVSMKQESTQGQSSGGDKSKEEEEEEEDEEDEEEEEVRDKKKSDKEAQIRKSTLCGRWYSKYTMTPTFDNRV